MTARTKAVGKTLFGEAAHAGFQATPLFPADYIPQRGGIRSGLAKALRQGVREKAPKLPGVYAMLDGSGRIVYIGKAKHLRTRLLSYFRVNSRDPKAGRILQRTRKIIWETAPNEFSALLRELELIQQHRPRFNVQGQPGMRRYVYLCVGRPAAPTIYTVAKPTGKEEACYGPFTGWRRAASASRLLNDLYRLRDCSQKQKMVFADQPDLFGLLPAAGCLRHEIATCSGPCAGGCTSAAYAVQVRRAMEFLKGNDAEPIRKYEAEMARLADSQLYERAAEVKEKWEILVRLRERLGFLRQAREEHSFVYASPDHDGRTIWTAIHRGIVQKVLFEPRTKRQKLKALEEIRLMFADPLRLRQSTLRCFDSVLLVTAWFRRFPDERQKMLDESDWKSGGRAETLKPR